MRLKSFLDNPTISSGESAWVTNLAPEQQGLLRSLTQLPTVLLNDLSGVGFLPTLNRRRVRVVLDSAHMTPVGTDTRLGQLVTPIITGTGDVLPHLQPTKQHSALDNSASWIENGDVVQMDADVLLPSQGATVVEELQRGWQAWRWTGPRIEAIAYAGDLFLPGLDFIQQQDRVVLLDSMLSLVGAVVLVYTAQERPDGRAAVAGITKSVGAALDVRARNTLHNLQKFAVEACSIYVAPVSSVVRAVSSCGQRYRVSTDLWECVVSSTSLQIGDAVEAGTQLGGTFKLHHGVGPWWSTLDWSYGLDLDELWPVPGVRTDNSNVTARRVGDTVSFSGLQGSSQSLQLLVLWLTTAQQLHQVLIETLGLGDGDSLTMPALDLLVGHLIGARRVIVVEHDGRHPDVLRFVRANLPLNCVALYYRTPS